MLIWNQLPWSPPDGQGQETRPPRGPGQHQGARFSFLTTSISKPELLIHCYFPLN